MMGLNTEIQIRDRIKQLEYELRHNKLMSFETMAKFVIEIRSLEWGLTDE